MPNKRLHIVCLDAPSPPNYGGVYDLFYKIPALAAQGYRIHLHYFQYGKNRSASGLESYCEKINTYTRSGFFTTIHSHLPYIVSSRKNRTLLRNLLADNDPILVEGVHCTGLIHKLQTGRCVMVRMHNNEAAYYHYLAQHERNFLKRLYLRREAKLLSAYQKKLPKEALYLFVSLNDEVEFRQHYNFQNTITLPIFLPWQHLSGNPGAGDYCLYHGNLSVPENEAAVLWLVNNLKVQRAAPLVIAGRNPGAFLQRLLSTDSKIKLVANPTAAEMELLIREAHIHLLPSFNNTGVKIKLLHALFKGRHCITNKAGAAGVNNNGLFICHTASEWQECITKLMQQPFEEEDKEKRLALLTQYNNQENADTFSRFLSAHCRQ